MTAADTIEARRAYLRGLTWDRARRVDHFAAEVLHQPTRAAAARCAGFLRDAVARAFSPGAEVGPALLLCGPQGTHKSTVLSVLAGPEHHDQIATLRAPTAAPWIVDIGDPGDFGEAQVKAFVGRLVDVGRAPYSRRVTRASRPFVVACTTNHVAPALARHFAAIRIDEPADTALLTTWRDQLWAEAMEMHRRSGGAT